MPPASSLQPTASPRWPACQYSGRGGRSAVARRRRKKNGSDEGSGHSHLKVAAMAGRLKPVVGA